MHYQEVCKTQSVALENNTRGNCLQLRVAVVINKASDVEVSICITNKFVKPKRFGE